MILNLLFTEVKADQIVEESVPQQVKQERLEIEKPNDISVYDFDEGEIFNELKTRA